MLQCGEIKKEVTTRFSMLVSNKVDAKVQGIRMQISSLMSEFVE